MILASTIAQVTDTVSPEVADASAALVVSVLIAVSLVPLFSGFVSTVLSLRAASVFHHRAKKRRHRLTHGVEISRVESEEREQEGLLEASYDETP